jgi:hypothetical protein
MSFHIKNGSRFLKIDTYESYTAYNWLDSDINVSVFTEVEAKNIYNRILELYKNQTDNLEEPLSTITIKKILR